MHERMILRDSSPGSQVHAFAITLQGNMESTIKKGLLRMSGALTGGLVAIGFSCIPGPLWLNVAFAVLVEAAIVWIVPSPLVTRLPLSLSSHRAYSRSVQGLY